MHLLHLSHGGKFSLVTFSRNNVPAYAILSHTWGLDSDEVTFRDITEGSGENKTGFAKIRFCGEQAARDGLQYFWVDTCCIDKSSSAELAEAINSMFRWYREAAKCYVYLTDVSFQNPKATEPTFRPTWESSFRQARWFTRGWALQELIAPTSLIFFSNEGNRLGDKKSLELQVHDITGIPVQCLRGGELSSFDVQERMSWTAGRETTREEDNAYCLLGIFDVYMPLIYGEGRKHAFRRLHEELKRFPDKGREVGLDGGQNSRDVRATPSDYFATEEKSISAEVKRSKAIPDTISGPALTDTSVSPEIWDQMKEILIKRYLDDIINQGNMYRNNVGAAIMNPSVSSSPPVTGWSNLGGRFNAEVAVTSWAPGRIDIFIQGTDTAVYHKWKQGNVWGPDYEFLGGKIIGSPVAVSWGSDRIDLFVQGINRAVQHKWWDGSRWGPSATDYEDLGGIIIGDPVVVTAGANQLDVFVRGVDNRVYHKWWNGSYWVPSGTGEWECLSGVILGDISAVSSGADRIDLFVLGTDSAVHHKWFDGRSRGWNPSMSNWETLGGHCVGDPVAVSTGPNRLDVFFQGKDTGLYHKWWNGRNWCPSVLDWEFLGSGLIGNPSPVSWGSNKLEVFVRGLDSAVYRKSWNGSSWSPSVIDYVRLGGIITSRPVPTPQRATQPEVFARGTDNGLWMWS